MAETRHKFLLAAAELASCMSDSLKAELYLSWYGNFDGIRGTDRSGLRKVGGAHVISCNYNESEGHVGKGRSCGNDHGVCYHRMSYSVFYHRIIEPDSQSVTTSVYCQSQSAFTSL